MNVALVIGTFLPEAVGGTEVQAAELARRLAERHGIVVLTRQDGKGGTTIDLIGSARVFRHPIPRAARGRSLRAILAKRRTLVRLAPAPEVLLCYHLADAGFIGHVLSRATGIPY